MPSTDALLLVSFGGPEGPDDVVPFLENVTRGRGIPRERLEQVGAHYRHFGGVSPINAQNRALLAAVRADLARHGLDRPVAWGNRNWAPHLPDALRELADRGVQRVHCFVTSAYSSYSGCRQYRENLWAAQQAAGTAFDLVKLRPYHREPGFVAPFVDATVQALEELPSEVRDGAVLAFTTHSIPVTQADSSGPAGGAYVSQHLETAQLVADGVAERTGVPSRRWDLVFQSRSGSPEQPWLEPDIGDHVRALADSGAPAVVAVPIGFVSDHVEVMWDLDHEAAAVAAEVGLPWARAGTPGTDPRFVAVVRQLVVEQVSGALTRGEAGWCGSGCCPNPRGALPAVVGAP